MCSALSAGSARISTGTTIAAATSSAIMISDAAVAAGGEEAARVDHASTALPLSANRPRGRFWMNRMMRTSTTILPSTAPA